MAKTQKTPTEFRPNGKATFNGFVNYNLTDADKAKFRSEWSGQQAENSAQYLQQLIDAGYKVSLSYDKYNEAYSATMMCLIDKHPDNGWCLSGKSGVDITEAIDVLFFKHYVCLKEQWVSNAKSVSAQKGDIS